MEEGPQHARKAFRAAPKHTPRAMSPFRFSSLIIALSGCAHPPAPQATPASSAPVPVRALVAAADTIAITYRLRTPGARLALLSQRLTEALGSATADSFVTTMLRRDTALGICSARLPEECLRSGTTWFYALKTASWPSADTVVVRALMVELNLEYCRDMGGIEAPDRSIVVARSADDDWHAVSLGGEGWPFLACHRAALPRSAP